MKSILLLAALSASALPQAAPQPPSANPAQSPLTTLHSRGRVVLVDVVVTGTHDQPVRTLKKSDFTVLEDGKPQTILAFESHITGQAPPPAPMPKLEPGVFTNYTGISPTGALNVLLLDTLNTPMKDQSFVRSQLLDFLKSSPAGARMAIFGLNTQLLLLQGFTTDPAALRAALDSKKSLKASSLLNNPVRGDTPGQDSPGNDAIAMLQSIPGAESAAANLIQFESQAEAQQTELRVRYTLEAMNQLGRYLAGIPGRKNLIWFSGSFPLNIMPDVSLPDPFANVSSFQQEFRDTASLLTHAQVAVYPIDARGLMTSPIFNAENSGRSLGRNPAQFAKLNSDFSAQMASDHSTMEQMARDTGGQAFYNTNGLRQAVQKVMDLGSNYYTIAYTPANTNYHGDYRKIKVQLAQPGYNLSYRRGYFAEDPTPKVKNAPPVGAPADPSGKPAAAPASSGLSAMRTAMLRGGPEPAEIMMKVRIRPIGKPEDDLAPGNLADPKLHGPYNRYVLAIAALPTDFLFTTTPDGLRHAVMEFVTLVYDANGQLFNSVTSGVHADVTPANYANLQRIGVQFQQQISVPARGEYFLRIGIHDLLADHVGALEVPVSAVRNLPTTPPTAPKP